MRDRRLRSRIAAAAVFAAAGATALAVSIHGAQAPAAKPAGVPPYQAGTPAFQVEVLWPKPLPNHWILGSITGVAVDAQNHVWVVHRGQASLTARTEAAMGLTPPGAETCCLAAPPVLEFDAAGALVGHWGGPGQGYDWPQNPGGIAVDAKGNVWITAQGSDPAPARGGGGGRGGAAPATPPAPPPPSPDAQVLKFDRAGKFLLAIGQSGKPGAADSTTGLNRPTAIDVDGGDVFVADAGNRRVVVFDAETGAYKRHWGAYGEKAIGDAPPAYDPAAPPSKQFRSVSCVAVAKDGQVYVCDRTSNRIQVFKRDGTFVKEAILEKDTRGTGAVWDVAFSNDATQRQLLVADGQNQKVRVLQRDTLAPVAHFGSGGRWPGYFYAVGSIAVDARGTVYTGEGLEGKRVQKFIRK